MLPCGKPSPARVGVNLLHHLLRLSLLSRFGRGASDQHCLRRCQGVVCVLLVRLHVGSGSGNAGLLEFDQMDLKLKSQPARLCLRGKRQQREAR